jgi:GT2 family glycosyltransferase
MISIIICSRKSDISEELKTNIQSTIGIEYELIVIDNSKNKYSIFHAYNLGVSRAKYPYLCFMHDDILFHTIDWGERTIQHFKNSEVGIIGVAGGHYIPDSPSAWFSSNVNSINILQSSFERDLKKTKQVTELNYLDGIKVEVVAVDGVWFCIPKLFFNTISFDENTFKGFHCYDLDICFQVRNAGYKVLVVSDILLEHFSGGSCNNEWFENSIIFHNKWKKKLPQIAGVLMTKEEIQIKEKIERDKFILLNEINILQLEIIRIRKSKAYQIGKIILKPFSFLRHKILKK